MALGAFLQRSEKPGARRSFPLNGMTQPIKVLVVDDSPAQLALLVGLLRSAGDFEVVGTAADGRAAVGAVDRLRPQVVAMDIHLPLLDGYEATRQIMERCPTPIVMVSSSGGDAERRSLQALAAGALAVVRKPGAPIHPGGSAQRDQFLTTMRLMAGVRVVTRHPRRPPTGPGLAASIAPPAPRARPEVVAVAASTGGPAALQALLAGLGPGFPLPILVAQHIARGFSVALVEWLAGAVPLPVRIAGPEERLAPGVAYLAPDDHHLLAAGAGRAGLAPYLAGDRYCPSADRLFGSVADAYGSRAVGVIMTGMGDDGVQGLGRMRAAGALTLAQDEASCVVYGMPKAAVAAGAATSSCALAALPLAVLAALRPAAGQTRELPGPLGRDETRTL